MQQAVRQPSEVARALDVSHRSPGRAEVELGQGSQRPSRSSGALERGVQAQRS